MILRPIFYLLLCISFLPAQVFGSGWHSIPVEKLNPASIFIHPNEENFQLFNPFLEGADGVLISVGTFRAFHDASIGLFEFVIFLDITKQVNEFNRQHIEMIEHCSDRYEYLEKLFALNGLRRHILDYENGHIDSAQIKIILEHAIEQIAVANPGSIYLVDNYLQYMAKFIGDKEKYRKTFLGSDAAFAQLQKIAKQRRYLIVGGSLSGVKVMPWLARELKNQGKKVSILNISNVFDVIRVSGDEDQFSRNLKALPYTETASILYTVQSASAASAPWLYLKLPYLEYIRKLESYNGNDSVFYPEFNLRSSVSILNGKTSADHRCPDLLK